MIPHAVNIFFGPTYEHSLIFKKILYRLGVANFYQEIVNCSNNYIIRHFIYLSYGMQFNGVSLQ